MAIKPLRSNLIGVGVYFVGLGIIVAGGVYWRAGLVSPGSRTDVLATGNGMGGTYYLRAARSDRSHGSVQALRAGGATADCLEDFGCCRLYCQCEA